MTQHDRIGRSSAMRRGAFLLLAAWLGTAPPVSAQEPAARTIGLEEALAEAREHNAGLRVSGEAAEMARARARQAASPLYPNLDLEAGWSRTVDPVGVFGTKLRQGTFGEADFAVSSLNDPAPLDDWTARATLRWEIGAPRRWAGRSAAASAARAASWRATRTREATDLGTRLRFYDALRAEDRVEAARAALEAARATVERFRRRHEEGMLTRADLLQARAERSGARAEVARAEQARYDARSALAVHLGWSPGDSLPDPAGDLTMPAEGGAEETSFDPTARADLRARRAAVKAAESSLDEARLAWVPSLGAFAAASTHGIDGFGDDGSDWTVGVGLRWSLFSGFRRPARVDEAGARLTTARIEYEQRLREARAEVRTARRSVEATRRGVEASREAREAAREGRDLMRRRFEEGLATPADLLQAEARATGARARLVDALARYHMAAARLRFARARSDRREIR